MSVNLDLIKARLSKLNKSNNRAGSTWKPKPGKQVIRILPYKHNPDFPFLEMYFHYDFNRKTYLSPLSFDRPDPIAELSDELKRKGDKENWSLGRKLEPTMRIYVPVIVRGEEEKGVRFWGFGKRVYQDILSLMDDAEYGDITDLKRGTDLTVEVIPPKNQNEYQQTQIRPRRDATPASTEKSVLDAIASMPKIEDVFDEPSYEELEKALTAWVDQATASTQEADTPTPTAPSATASTETATNSAVNDFEDLFNEE